MAGPSQGRLCIAFHPQRNNPYLPALFILPDALLPGYFYLLMSSQAKERKGDGTDVNAR